jgi:flagellar biogenesis protein FliO
LGILISLVLGSSNLTGFSVLEGNLGASIVSILAVCLFIFSLILLIKRFKKYKKFKRI